MPVERVDPKGEIPGAFIKNAIEEIEKKGTITQILPLQDEVLVVWTPRRRETRETRSA